MRHAWLLIVLAACGGKNTRARSTVVTTNAPTITRSRAPNPASSTDRSGTPRATAASARAWKSRKAASISRALAGEQLASAGS